MSHFVSAARAAMGAACAGGSAGRAGGAGLRGGVYTAAVVHGAAAGSGGTVGNAARGVFVGAGGLREQRQREELVAYVFGKFLAGRHRAEAVGGDHQLYLGEDFQNHRHTDGDAESAVAQIGARYADGADQTFQGEGHDGAASTVLPSASTHAMRASLSAGKEAIAASAIASARALNSSFLATKSVSQPSPTMIALSPFTLAITRPSEVSRSARFAATSLPFSRMISLALS